MKWKIPDPKTCLHLVSVIVLLVGLGTSVSIYRTAEDSSDEVLGYEIIDGQAYPVMPEDSKVYLRNLQRYGGKEMVLLDDLRRGFAGLWHGKSLAFTLAFITFLVSFAAFFIANHLPSNSKAAKGDQ